jgi:hypothetical protein
MAYTTINKSTDHFNTKLFSGNGSTNAITGVGFQPDWVWSKSRNQTGHHLIYDAVRGVQKFIQSSTSNAESTNANTLTSFDSDGMTFGSADNGNSTSSNGVAWCWKANGQGSSNTDGDITSTVSANTTSGFSIVTYTGTGSNATVGHGLGVAPKVVLIKQTNGTAWWFMYHNDLGTTGKLNLNTTGYNNDLQASYWNSTAPSSSVFSLGTEASVNGSSQNFVAYCFAEKIGFSSMSSYVANGSNDNAFCYTGFKPAFILIKSATTDMYWHIFDDKRQGFNPNNYRLNPNTNEVETTTTDVIDFLSNGFKIRTSQQQFGTSGATYIYMAFAEAPLVGSNNVPCTAR